ncbi:MAG: CocE/NonD family hydrolase, partial [bacterium]
LTAARRPPGLKAVAASVARMSNGYSHYYPGGVLEEAYLRVLDQLWDGSWESITGHPEMGPWWEQMQAEQTIPPESIDVPILLQSGWWAHNVDLSFEGFAALRERSPKGRTAKLLIGPWSHGSSGFLKQGDLAYPDAVDMDKHHVRRFFDRWLRGRDNGVDRESPVHYYQLGRNKWVAAATWPPASRDRAYYLRAGSRLSDAPPGIEAPDSYSSVPSDPSPSVGGPITGTSPQFPDLTVGPAYQDARVLTGRGDYRIYDSAELNQDVDVAGAPRLRLFVASDQPDADLAVRLCDYDPAAPEDRRTLLVMTGIRRLRYRKSWTSAAFLSPEALEEARIEMNPIAYTWRKGHKVRIIVSSSNYPLYSVNPQNGDSFIWEEREERVATIRIHHDDDHPSVLVLPVKGGR